MAKKTKFKFLKWKNYHLRKSHFSLMYIALGLNLSPLALAHRWNMTASSARHGSVQAGQCASGGVNTLTCQ